MEIQTFSHLFRLSPISQNEPMRTKKCVNGVVVPKKKSNFVFGNYINAYL